MTNMNAQPARMTKRRTTIFGAFLTAIGPIAMGIYTPAMPVLAQAFETTDSAIKVSLALYFGGFSIAQLLAGPTADGLGRRKASLIFLAIFFIGSLVACFATNIETLFAGRLLQGIGASVGVTVARAIVRDQFTGSDAASILNLIGIMMAIGPAMAPTLGGLLLAALGWQSIFVVLALLSLTALGTVMFLLTETTAPDSNKLNPKTLLSNYLTLLSNKRFMCACLVLGGTVGALYAQATMLSFILINDVGLSPTQFGMSMLMQSGAYFFGSVALKFVAPRLGDRTCAVIGLGLCAAGGLLIAISAFMITPSLLSIMGPVAVATFGIAFVTPYIITASLAPFPHIAGSAAALTGFTQMAMGFLAGMVAALIDTPLLGFGHVIPALELIAVLGYLGFREKTRI